MGGPTVNVFIPLVLLTMFSGESRSLAQATTNFTITAENTTSGMSSVALTTVTMTAANSAPDPGRMSNIVLIGAIVGGILFLVLLGVSLIVLACRVGRRRGRSEQTRPDQDVESAGTPSTDSGHASHPATPGDEPGGGLGTELIPLSDLKARRDAPASPPRSSSRDERAEWIPFAQLEAARSNWDDPAPLPPDEDADVYSVIPDRQNPKDEDDNLYETPVCNTHKDEEDNPYDTPPVDKDEDDNLYETPATGKDGDDNLYDTPPIEEEDYYSSIGDSKPTQSKPQESQKPSEDTLDQMYAKVNKSLKRKTHQPVLDAKEDPPEDTGNYYFTLEEATDLKKETAGIEKDKKRPATWPTESSEGRNRIQGEV